MAEQNNKTSKSFNPEKTIKDTYKRGQQLQDGFKNLQREKTKAFLKKTKGIQNVFTNIHNYFLNKIGYLVFLGAILGIVFLISLSSIGGLFSLGYWAENHLGAGLYTLGHFILFLLVLDSQIKLTNDYILGSDEEIEETTAWLYFLEIISIFLIFIIV